MDFLHIGVAWPGFQGSLKTVNMTILDNSTGFLIIQVAILTGFDAFLYLSYMIETSTFSAQ